MQNVSYKEKNIEWKKQERRLVSQNQMEFWNLWKIQDPNSFFSPTAPADFLPHVIKSIYGFH